MGITIVKKPSRGKGEPKVFYTLAWGRGPGEREATGIYTYTKPQNKIQRDHNTDALLVLEKKRSQMVLDLQSVSVGSVPAQREGPKEKERLKGSKIGFENKSA
ncbi:MAG TPA: hypothetical protein VN616_03950, partial [Puia sp.]|nr:hypothetical protein [Puia sp.]